MRGKNTWAFALVIAFIFPFDTFADQLSTFDNDVLFYNMGACGGMDTQIDNFVKRCEYRIRLGGFRQKQLAEILLALGAAYDVEGRKADAELALRKAIEIDPKAPGAYVNLSDLYNRNGDYAHAASLLGSYLDINPENEYVLSARCWTHAIVGTRDDLYLALGDCNQALKIEPGLSRAYIFRGLTYYRLGEYSEALSDFTTALSSSPRASYALYMRGSTKMKLGDASGGNKDIADAVAIDPDVVADLAGYGVKM